MLSCLQGKYAIWNVFQNSMTLICVGMYVPGADSAEIFTYNHKHRINQVYTVYSLHTCKAPDLSNSWIFF